ncbi:MAG TPA: hypothetical protein VGV92_02120 [Gammaproteobacteria bacterium]|nr:hypothetical protein [Gammaproteobacteria bacterium]
MNDMQKMENSLEQILAAAERKIVADDIGVDKYGIKKVVLTSGSKIEVRYFQPDAYHGPKTEDFIERVNFLADVAVAQKPGDHDVINRLNAIREKYKGYINDRFKLNIVNGKPVDFDEIYKGVESLLLTCQTELIHEVYGEANTGKNTKAFDKASQQFLIQQGRPIIVHVMPDQSISALFPKGDKTYPSTYAERPDEGVNPNSVMDVVAYRKLDGTVEVESIGSRAVSFSSEKNARQDILDLLTKSGRGPYVPGQVIDITSISLVTPEKKIIKAGASVFRPNFESETEQSSVHHEALMALTGKTIEIDGVTVTLIIKHLNISVKDPKKLFEGSKIVINQNLLDHINARGFIHYMTKQVDALGISAISKNTDFGKLLRNLRPDEHQKRYFYEVCQAFYSETYKNSQDDAYRFVAKFLRSEELRGAFILWNCKSSKDRSGWESDYHKTLIDCERNSALNFNEQLKKNHEFGASLEANGKNAPGARGNRVDDPTKQDESKTDSRMSLLAKIHTPKRKILRKLAKLRVGDKDANDLIDRYLLSQSDERFVSTVMKLRKIENPILRVAMVNVLDHKGFGIPAEANVDDIVGKINRLFPTEPLMPKEFRKNYIEFLKIVGPLPGLNDLRQEFVTSIIIDGKLPDIKKLKLEDPRVIDEYIKNLETAIVFAKALDPKRAKGLLKFKKQLENALTPGLRFGELGPEQTAKTIYVYEASKGKFEKITVPEEDIDLSKKHAIYESEKQLRYKPPVDGSEPSDEVLWSVIQMAKTKFRVSDYSELKFEGALKERAEAIIQQKAAIILSGKEKMDLGVKPRPDSLQIKTPGMGSPAA